ncbi:hypothetical protein [Cryobacterium sp. M91]|uniref:hypothetical protein n=1 Tax=Cryobacterium sp. M91 TaxID=2048294 RepID=UPI000CE3B572|nr:hypothetical protein [Cryobacterium sp. M91]
MFRRLSRHSGERGSALIAVVGVMAVLLVITLTVTSSSLQALTVTTSIRAGVQAQAAAEAGIDAALAELQRTPSSCPTDGLFQSPDGTLPAYTSTVWTHATGWVQKCPTGAADETEVQIVSTGHAGADSAGLKTTRVVESIFTISGTVSPGPVVYSYGSAVVNQFSTKDSLGSPVDVVVATGDYTCTSSGTIAGNLIVNGAVSLYNSCSVAGDVYANGTVDIASWVTFTYDWSDFEKEGFVPFSTDSNELVAPGSKKCQLGSWVQDNSGDSLHQFYEDLRNLTKPTIVDVRQCDTFDFGSIEMNVKSDIAFLFHEVVVNDFSVVASDGNDHKIWFIAPGVEALGANKCSSNFTVNGSVQFDTEISAMLYTPCAVVFNRTQWRGQIYSESFVVNNTSNVDFVPMSIPGTDLYGAMPAGSDPDDSRWTLLSSRDRTNGDK